MTTRARIRATIAATMMSLVALAAILAPGAANAGWFTEITHAKDDSGYSSPIIIECHTGVAHSLYKGGWSGAYCGARTDYIYVKPGTKIRCQNLFPPFGWRTYYHGLHYVDGYTQLKCYVQLA